MVEFKEYIKEIFIGKGSVSPPIWTPEQKKDKVMSDIDTKKAEQAIEKLQKFCGPYLKEVKGGKALLWRGVKKPMGKSSVIVKRRRRKRRRPLDMPIDIHNRLDKIFNEKFGWKPRSQGVFAVSRKGRASYFGIPYMFFPIGSYMYLWSPDISDLYGQVSMNTPEKRLQELVDSYKAKGLNKLMSKDGFGNEVMFDVDNFYIVKADYAEYLEDKLL